MSLKYVQKRAKYNSNGVKMAIFYKKNHKDRLAIGGEPPVAMRLMWTSCLARRQDVFWVKSFIAW